VLVYPGERPMSRVYVTSRHFEPHSHTLTGLTLHVQFEGGTADVSMLDMSGLLSLADLPINSDA
jgi:hypothetical protein